MDGTGWVLREDACLRGGAGDTSSGRFGNDRRRRVTRARAAGRAAHPRRRASLRALRWGPGIIASRVGFPDRGVLIGLGASPGSSLGIKPNIRTLSLSLFFFLPSKKLETKPGSGGPSPTRASEGGGGKPKVAAARASPSSFSCVPSRRRPRRADPPNRGLGRDRAPEERSPGHPSLGPSGGASLPAPLRARPPPRTPCGFGTGTGGRGRPSESGAAPWAAAAPSPSPCCQPCCAR